MGIILKVLFYYLSTSEIWSDNRVVYGVGSLIIGGLLYLLFNTIFWLACLSITHKNTYLLLL